MWEEYCEVDEHVSHAGIWIGPPDVASSSSHALSARYQRSQMGLERHLKMLGHSMNCAGIPACLGRDLGTVTQQEIPGALSCSTPPYLENF